MKSLVFISIIISAIMTMACNNSGSVNSDSADSVISSVPKTILKITKQFVTNNDGIVSEIPVDCEVGYNEFEVSVAFKDSTEKSFTVEIESMEKKIEGIHIITKNRKYTNIFISSGAEPQVTFTSDRGGNMTLM